MLKLEVLDEPEGLALDALAPVGTRWHDVLWRGRVRRLAGWSVELPGSGRLHSGQADETGVALCVRPQVGDGACLRLGAAQMLWPDRPAWWESDWRDALALQALAPVLSMLQAQGLAGGPWRADWSPSPASAPFEWPMVLHTQRSHVPLHLGWPSLERACRATASLLSASPDVTVTLAEGGPLQLRPVWLQWQLTVEEEAALHTGCGLWLQADGGSQLDLAVAVQGRWARLGRVQRSSAPPRSEAGWTVSQLEALSGDGASLLCPLGAAADELVVLGPAWPLDAPTLAELRVGADLPHVEGPLLVCNGRGEQGRARLLEGELGRLIELTEWVR